MYCSDRAHRICICLDCCQLSGLASRLLLCPEVLSKNVEADEVARSRGEGTAIVRFHDSLTYCGTDNVCSTQFVETINGLATIRAFSWQQSSINHNYDLVDRSQKPFYLMYMIQRWLALVIDLVIGSLAVLVVGIAVALRGTISPGFTGVSMTQIISFTSYLKLMVMFWAQMETSIGAVARIRLFSANTPDENRKGEDVEPPPKWPAEGKVEISNLSASYKWVTGNYA
jgi:ABC-type multidrug transport system fused ATPase/permease subunit